ncbi:MAG TPA: dephospho-CoA kinase [bacterium]|nr:dephospho-CoA kinase [bacterium]
MKIVGLTGGIGSGKSVVAGFLSVCGAKCLDTDQVARDVAAPGSEGLRKIVDRFGTDVLQSSGELNREALAKIVFADPTARRELEMITHPLIFRAVHRWLSEQLTAGVAVAVLEIPLLFEVEVPYTFDATICVIAVRSVRLDRIRRRSEYDEATLAGILDAQMDQNEKAARADYVIDNSGTLVETKAAVEEIFQKIAADT